MVELPNVRLKLAGTAENMVVVRTLLAGIGESAGVGAGELNDVRTAVSEACNNVVLHAYRGESGPLEVAIALARDSIRVLVRDRGVGIGEHVRDRAGLGEGMGIGLHVIRTLTRAAVIAEAPGGGTLVNMEFAVRGPRALEPRLASGSELDLAGTTPDFAAAIAIAPVSLAGTLVPRLACALAVRAHFSTDRLSDVQMLADTLAAHAATLCERHVSFGFGVRPRCLELRVAPLRSGQADELVRASDVDGLGRVIEKLADRHETLAVDSHETLALSMLDPRAPPAEARE